MVQLLHVLYELHLVPRMYQEAFLDGRADLLMLLILSFVRHLAEYVVNLLVKRQIFEEICRNLNEIHIVLALLVDLLSSNLSSLELI